MKKTKVAKPAAFLFRMPYGLAEADKEALCEVSLPFSSRHRIARRKDFSRVASILSGHFITEFKFNR